MISNIVKFIFVLKEHNDKHSHATVSFTKTVAMTMVLHWKWSTFVLNTMANLYICSRNNQCCALICITPLFYILTATCFGSSLPSSGSFLDLSELLEIQICCASQLGGTTDRPTTLRHTGHITTHYMIYHPFDLYFM
jgi:hypothetical protein